MISPLLSNIYLHYVLDEWFEVTARADSSKADANWFDMLTTR